MSIRWGGFVVALNEKTDLDHIVAVGNRREGANPAH